MVMNSLCGKNNIIYLPGENIVDLSKNVDLVNKDILKRYVAVTYTNINLFFLKYNNINEYC